MTEAEMKTAGHERDKIGITYIIRYFEMADLWHIGASLLVTNIRKVDIHKRNRLELIRLFTMPLDGGHPNMSFDSTGRPQENDYLDDDDDFTPRDLADDGDIEMEDDADFHSHYSERRSSSASTSSLEDLEDPSTADNEIAMPSPLFPSNSSLHGPNAFAPPFYNRPPTPLPPSPSLTSLLRPSFSTTTSRPTTPDSSDVETPNDTEAAVARSARTAITVPRASPKVPTYEYYGFVLYLASSLAFLIYLLWSYLPSPFLHQLGIYYYPNRWWSLAIPSFLVATIIYIYVALSAYNTGYLTLPMNSIENIVDDAANIAVIDSKGRRRPGGSEKMNPNAATAQTMGPQKRKLEWKYIWNEGTDAVMDIPVGGVCEVLYGSEETNEHVDEQLNTSYSDRMPPHLEGD